MLFGIYLGTTSAAWIISLISVGAIRQRLEREGYKYIAEEKSTSEYILDIFGSIFLSSIPVYNVLGVVYETCYFDKVYEEVKKDWLAKGMIVPTNKTSYKEDKLSSEEEIKTHIEDIKKASTEQKYDEMSSEEKIAYLESEKQKLMNQSKTTAEQSYKENLLNIAEQVFEQEQPGPSLKKTINRK